MDPVFDLRDHVVEEEDGYGHVSTAGAVEENESSWALLSAVAGTASKARVSPSCLSLIDGDDMESYRDDILQGLSSLLESESNDDENQNDSFALVEEAESGMLLMPPPQPRSHSAFGPTCHRRAKGAPKRPLSAYNLFFKALRSRLVEKYGKGMSFTEIGKEIAIRWNSLSYIQRKKFDDLANQDSERYRLEMIEYRARNRSSRLLHSHPGRVASEMRTSRQRSPGFADPPSTSEAAQLLTALGSSNMENPAWDQEDGKQSSNTEGTALCYYVHIYMLFVFFLTPEYVLCCVLELFPR